MGENAVAMPFYPFKVIVNLCFSNLLSAVVVKSISIVHNAYAGDTGLDLAWDNIQTTDLRFQLPPTCRSPTSRSAFSTRGAGG